MKKTCILGSVLLILTGSLVAFGQVRSQSATATIGVPLAIPGPIAVDIREQPDSPLKLIIDDKAQGRMGTPLSVRNDGGTTITAFVLRIDVEPFGASNMVIVGPKGLGIGETRIQALNAPRSFDPQQTSKPVVSIDYIQFGDGKSWGEDSLGRGKQVAAYIEGRKLALSRLEQLLVGQDDTEYRKAFEVFGAASYSEPNLPTGRAPRPPQDWNARGYEEVVNILRRMPRNTDAAKELARKLEVMAAQKGS
jgi:hypothetical protein